MKSRLAAATLLASTLSAVGCSESTGPKPQAFIYPVEVGTRWIYNRDWIADYHGSRPDDTIRGTIVVTVTALDTLPTLGPATRIHSNFVDPTGEWEGVHFYQNREDGFYLVAACGSNSEALPKRTSRFTDLMASRHGLAGIAPAEGLGPPDVCEREGFYRLEDEPRILRYPLRIGDHWLFRDSAVAGREIDRVVESWEKVRTDAGTFWCYRIRWVCPTDPDLDLVDYVSEHGLIRRSLIVRNIVFTTPEYEFGGDTADVFVTTQLATLLAPTVP